MCDWGDNIEMTVPIPANCSHTGVFRWDTKKIDKCIAPIVKALNDAGLFTGGSCCGHGKRPGCISMHDGTVLTICKTDPDKMPCAVLGPRSAKDDKG
jgi:hypothetical protein